MEYALAVHRCDQKKEDIQMIDNVNMEWICKKTPNRLMKIASWMMHMEEFREIEQDEQAVWTLWEPFETVATSLDVFGERVLTEQLFVISSEFAIQYKKAWLDLSSITDYPSEPIFKMFEPFIRRIIDDVARKLYEMKVSKIEEAYMLCQLAWHLSGKELKRSTIDAGDRFLEEIANDLHEYYMDINLGHYAARLIQLMNIVNDWKKIFMDRQKVLELAKLFDVFNVVPSEPDLLFYPS
ncbi:unnamed protein product [Caenorhabditis auriculariae]|uniref:NR LBD domain-containing protein n=1 Tax=Caenorhabditis auriculariae TaxID=2777116 RepID=A0A8S1HIV2_9PELO|nr:unnamed protein product [Caenorhabditis auriculariae]